MRRVLESGIELEERFVIIEAALDRGTAERKHDHALEAMQRRELAVERQQHVVDDQEAVPGVRSDPAGVARREAQVERVHDPARGRNAEVALQMSVMVPKERGDAIALLKTQPPERRAERAGAGVEVGVGMAPQALVGQPRDDLRSGK